MGSRLLPRGERARLGAFIPRPADGLPRPLPHHGRRTLNEGRRRASVDEGLRLRREHVGDSFSEAVHGARLHGLPPPPDEPSRPARRNRRARRRGPVLRGRERGREPPVLGVGARGRARAAAPTTPDTTNNSTSMVMDRHVQGSQARVHVPLARSEGKRLVLGCLWRGVGGRACSRASRAERLGKERRLAGNEGPGHCARKHRHR